MNPSAKMIAAGAAVLENSPWFTGHNFAEHVARDVISAAMLADDSNQRCFRAPKRTVPMPKAIKRKAVRKPARKISTARPAAAKKPARKAKR